MQNVRFFQTGLRRKLFIQTANKSTNPIYQKLNQAKWRAVEL